jgi:signal transduction histidine kinase
MPTSVSLRRQRLYWILQLTCWLLYAVLGGAISAFYTKPFSLKMAVATQVGVVLIVGGLSHAFRAWVRRHGWTQLPVWPLLRRLVLALPLLALLSQLLLSAHLIWVVGAFTAKQFSWIMLLVYTANATFVYSVWALVYFSVHYFEQYRQSEVDKWKLTAAVREAEMQTLKAQINPHFLFNGLNNIRALIGEDPEQARRMLSHLSELLRYAIQLNRTEQVPLSRELAVVRDYLQLESLQLEERLHYTIEVADECLAVQVPPMLVQVLVENAIKHGIAPRPDGGTLLVRARCADASLWLTVENTGELVPNTPPTTRPDGTGTGIRNATERLRLLFGDKAELRLEQAGPETVVAHVKLPLRTEQAPTREKPERLHSSSPLA